MSVRHYCMCRSTAADRFMIQCDVCNEWFHGDCVSMSESKAKTVRRFYCPPCREKDPSLIIEFRTSSKVATPQSAPPSIPPIPPKRPAPPPSAPPNRCGRCIGCFRTDDCARCISCKLKTRFGGPGPDDVLCKQRECVNKELLSAPPPRKVAAPKGRPKGGTKAKVKNVTRTGTGGTRGTRSGTKAYQAFLREAGLQSDEETDEVKQCMGPTCTKQTRKGSKYCSDDCGMEMAKRRLLTILPGKLESWDKEPSAADQRDKVKLENVRQNQSLARDKLEQLEGEEHALEAWLKQSTNLRVDSSGKQQEAEEAESDDVSIYCPVCGLEATVRQAARHIAKCSAKYESQTSYGSAFKATSNPYNIFCDAYNKTSRTYCKRLRVICPEHSKEPAAGDHQVCAYPLGWDGSKLSAGDINTRPVCRVAKKKCFKHYQWDKVTRGLIDLNRLTQLLKLDELFEQERALRLQLAARGSVLAVLLNETTKH